MKHTTWLALAGTVTLAMGLSAGREAVAAIPNTVLVEGVLHATGGGAAADGDYAMTFSLVKGANDTTVWSEGPVQIKVASAVFVHALGSAKALDAALLAGTDALSLQIRIGEDPALPKQPLNSALFALRAGLSEGLACSGCITAAQLNATVIDDLIKSGALSKAAKSGDFSDLIGGPDLTPYALTAKLAKVASSGAYADLLGVPDLSLYAKATALATVATSGSYADLENLPMLPKLGASCGTGLVIKGLKADGSYECVVAMDPAALPKDGLDEISNGLLFNQFNEVAVSTKTPTAVPDNNPVGISDLIDVPDFGVAQVLSITAEVTNSDTANLVINVIDPTGSKFVLWSKTAKGTAVKTTWPTDTKTASGDLTTWIGKNPKGKWYIEVIDTAFLTNTTDGELKSWSVNVKVLSSGKVGLSGALQLKNATEPPFTCTTSTTGSIYFDTKTNAIRYCSGGLWRSVADSCGNGILESSEECDDGNNTEGDTCSATCIAAVGYLKSKPGASCLDILTKGAAAGLTLKDGVAWIDPNGGAATDAFQVYCDMTTDGGGWTLVGKVPGQAFNGDNGVLDGADTARWKNKQYVGSIADLSVEPALGQTYELVPFKDFLLQGLNDKSKKLAWRMGETFTSLYTVFNGNVQRRATSLLVGSHKTLDWRPGCGTGNGPDATGPQFYGFNINSDLDVQSTLFNGYSKGWCMALAGWGRDNNATDYTGGGLGVSCYNNHTHQMGRHYWGYGDGCDATGWNAQNNFNSFYGHAFFVR